MPLRKICLTCLESIFDISPHAAVGGNGGSRLDVGSLLQVMPLVLADKDELKMQAHQVCFVPHLFCCCSHTD